MSNPENPNAFPAPDDGRPSDGYGMSLRDYFAGQVLAAVYKNQMALSSSIAAAAYQIADEMLVEREKGPSQ